MTNKILAIEGKAFCCEILEDIVDQEVERLIRERGRYRDRRGGRG